MGQAKKGAHSLIRTECEMRYRAVSSALFSRAHYHALSDLRIVFTAPQGFAIGEAVEIHIMPRQGANAAFTAFVEVIHVERALSAGDYDVTALIKTIKG